mmetsp:Transcript_4943/g.12014  ORF Transcript_4943/g.12014 Transcript_4943/m.12014 type:complete len:253 (+) Transcript_4943:804-1562(+)
MTLFILLCLASLQGLLLADASSGPPPIAAQPIALSSALATERHNILYTDGECAPVSDCHQGTELNSTDFQIRLDNAFSNCQRFGMEQLHCDAFREFSYALIKTDSNGVKCLTTEDRAKLFEVLALVMPFTGPTPADDGPTTATTPTATDVIGYLNLNSGSRLTANRRAARQLRTSAKKLIVNGKNLSLCQTIPQYKPNTVAFPQCAALMCSLYAVHPHLRAAEHEACCAAYPNAMGKNLKNNCWRHPIYSIG